MFGLNLSSLCSWKWRLFLSLKMMMFLISCDWEKLHAVPHTDVGSMFVLTVSPAPAGLMLGVCVVRWSRLGPTVLCDQSDQMESPPLLSPGYRLSGCQEHNYELPVNWCVMEFNISPDMMTNTSKWKISFSGPSALIIDWRVPFLSRKWFGGRWPIIIQSFDHLAV